MSVVIAISAGLLLGVVFRFYQSCRSSGSERDGAAEAREAGLSQRLLDGRMDVADYQRGMAELAHPSADTTAGVR